MHALLFGVAGALLGALTARIGPATLRRLTLVLIAAIGLIAVFTINDILADLREDAAGGNSSLGGGVFLLALLYVHSSAVRLRA